MGAILAVVITGLFFFGIYKLLAFLVSKSAKKYEKDCKEKNFILNYKSKYDDETKREIENFFESDFNKKTLPIFLTNNNIFVRHHSSAKKYGLKDVVWAYGRNENTVTKFSHTTIISRSYLVLHLDNGRKKYLPIRDAFYIKEILEEIYKFAPWIIVGYSDVLKKNIRRNFDNFVVEKNKKYNEIKQNNNEDDMSGLHFSVRDKNGRHWGVWGDKLKEFTEALENKDKPKTEEKEKQIKEMQKKLLDDMLEKRLEINKDLVFDVCFSDNVCGELKLNLPEKTEVISIPLFFDIGSLQDGALDYQKENILSFYLPYGVSEKECNEIFDKIKRSINIVIAFAQKGGTLRVWVQETSTSMCDFYYLMSLICNYDCKVIKGKYQSDDKNLLDNLENLSPEQINKYADMWNELVKDNADLRVERNGDIRSVNKNYFDNDILEIVGNSEITAVKLIAKLLSKYKVADFYIAGRINDLVNNGKLEVVGIDEKTNSPFNQIVKIKQ